MAAKRISIETDEERDRRITELMGLTGARTKAELFEYALSLYDWAITEASEGKAIASVDRTEKQLKEVEMPPFTVARNRRRRPSGEGTD